ncbi:hypothetical protein DMA12_38070 [Amycolatopsis balhimycina DSM 5908]|jgi:hypothetical protein|uniref:Transcriptional regulator n=1 Tax=Amycolatopsis balhimycina DSM 5908 TaxID=1081091 RepID=A0A428W212_AMYBA|nr:hypothetical protein [Amycolatopsis balhimycina]RSM37130.1 hypothetical protein DMA12_38070 [Amycolatopsis balhimycina DSM 5908]
MSTHPNALSRRAIAMLKAVAEGRAELRCSCEPDLRVDGLSCCDQNTAHDLAHAGLVRATRLVAPGQWAPAELTDAGHRALSGVPAAAA